MSDSDLVWENKKTLYAYKDPKSGRGYELRVGRWIINGRPHELIVVKQEFEETVSGFTKWGKARGFNAADLYRVFSFGSELSDMMVFRMPGEFVKAVESQKGQSELFEEE